MHCHELSNVILTRLKNHFYDELVKTKLKLKRSFQLHSVPIRPRPVIATVINK